MFIMYVESNNYIMLRAMFQKRLHYFYYNVYIVVHPSHTRGVPIKIFEDGITQLHKGGRDILE